jgi:pimeloyl-ACP methyl ester carboxylesterase
MDYTNKFFELRKIFNQTDSRIAVDENMEILNFPFNSESLWPKIIDEQKMAEDDQLSLGVPDSHFFENNHFTYSTFVPRKQKRYSEAIVLLHGLNERHWDKYLPWAYYLAFETQRPVILFPIAFHMNRGPVKWNNAKELAPLIVNRKQKFNTEALTFANIALSTRLTEDPLRFLKSGQQTAEDLILLLKQMEQGLLPIFEKGTRPDVFAYSIGAFVSQIIFLAHNQGILNNSKLFLFCGGAFFNQMNGVSKLIMDNVAFNSIYKYYTSGIYDVLGENKLLSSLLTEFPLGKAFYAMLKDDNNKDWRENTIKSFARQIQAVTLKKDSVIPATGTDNVLKFTDNAWDNNEIMDFPFDYSHEVPFPVSGKNNSQLVDLYFNKVFSKASEFLA